MNFQDFKTKFKNVVDISADFVSKNRRYFLAGFIFLTMVLVLFLGTKPGDNNEKSTAGVSKKYSTKTSSELEKLINDYYTAYANGDTETIKTLADPVSDQEVSYIQFYSNFIEKFSDIKIYTKQGLTADSYLVTTEVTLKYNDIDTAAPGLDFFYVETRDGKLIINNIYGSFNQNNNIYEMDAEVSDLIGVFIRQQDLLDMEAEIQSAYDKALESDDTLNSFMKDELPSAIVQWHTNYEDAVKAAEEQAAKEAEEAAKAAEEEAKKQAEAEEEAKATTGKTNAKANVRETADKSGNKLGTVAKGTSVKIYGEEGDFYKVDYEGKRAYIAKELINVAEAGAETEEPAEEEATEAVGSLAEGTEVTLSQTVNIRSQMDTSASKVAVAYSGEKVTVVMSYAEGWTKVKYKKKEGFVKTDLLK